MAIPVIVSITGPAPSLIFSTWIIISILFSITFLKFLDSSLSRWNIFITDVAFRISDKNFVKTSLASKLLFTYFPIFLPSVFEKKAAIGIIIIAKILSLQFW